MSELLRRGRAPARTGIAPEAQVALNGKVNGMQGGVPTNLPVAGARVEIHEVSATSGARLGAAAAGAGALQRRSDDVAELAGERQPHGDCRISLLSVGR